MFPQLNIQPLGTLSTTQLLPLGTIVYSPKDQGRTAFRYVQFGGTSTINPGLLVVTPAAPSNSTGLAIPTSNSAAQLTGGGNPASNQLIITNGSTAVTANQFADGIITITGGTYIEHHRILGNSADATGSLPITVEMAGPLINTVVAGTNTVSLRQSPSYNVVASLTAANPVGVTIVPVLNTASVTNFGWVQLSGQAYVQATSATKGQALVQDTSGTAGYFANSAASTTPAIAIAQESASSSLAVVNLFLN